MSEFGKGPLNSARYTAAIDGGTWQQVGRNFTGRAMDQWCAAFEQLSANLRHIPAMSAFAAGSAAVAQAFGVEQGLAVGAVAARIERSAGIDAAVAFLAALPEVAAAVKTPGMFRAWLRTVEELASLAPESAEAVLRQSASVLSRLSVLAFRSWMLNGVRLSAGDPVQRMAYFSHTDTSALLPFERLIDDVAYSDVEPSLRAFLMALWKVRPIIRTATIRPGAKAMRRAAFENNFIRIPEVFSGYRGSQARAHFYAVMAHIGAHLAFTRDRFPVGTLKPLQVALVGLIEDARVERLAARNYPGLARLWLPFHTAQPGTALTAELLMMRLSRALIDPAYKDDDPWVNKGRLLFHEARNDWENPAISRRIGGLLGNDMGQMRIQFNAKSYVVEPSYRDDNTGIWDFGDQPPEESQVAETVLESVRVTQKESDNNPDKREKDPDSKTPANVAAQLKIVPDDVGIPIAQRPEWDHVSGSMRHDWTTILEFGTEAASAASVDAIVAEYAEVEQRIAKLVKAAKVSRPQRLRRQAQGDRLDLDACIRAAIERRIGLTPDPRLYEASEMRARDLSVLVLLDISESTRDRVKGTTNTVIGLEKAATALLAQAMSELGDPFALHAFCSNGREEVRYYRVKDFAEAYGEVTRARLAGLRSGLSTRLGAALRQAGDEVSLQATHRKLVLVVTDGEPSDVDVTDGSYLVEDARKAVQELSHQGVNVFCVGLDNGGQSYMARIFGARNYLMLSRIDALPEKLPMLYFRLTL